MSSTRRFPLTFTPKLRQSTGGDFPKVALAALALAAFLVPASAPRAGGHYHVVSRWKIGGEGGWDCLAADAVNRRLYVTHGTQVEILDLDRGTPIGTIPGLSGAHGVALAQELGRGFVTSGRDSALVAFDLKSGAVLQRVAVPARSPDAVVFDPVTRRVFAFDAGSDNTCAFDAATGAFLDSLPLGGAPEFAVADGNGSVFVNLESTSEVVAFDAKTLTIERRWSLAPGEEPTGLAFDPADRLLFSACHNGKLVVSDAAAGKVVATASIGSGVDGAEFDAKRRVVLVPCGEGRLDAVNVKAHGALGAVESDSTQRGARTMALDAKTGRAFVVTAEFGPAPEPTAERPHPRPSIVPGTFQVLVLDR